MCVLHIKAVKISVFAFPSPLSRWSVISGPSDRMATLGACACVCVLSAVTSGYKGNTPGWHRQSVSYNASDGSHDRANKTRTPFQLGASPCPHVTVVIDECHQAWRSQMPFKFQLDWTFIFVGFIQFRVVVSHFLNTVKLYS